MVAAGEEAVKVSELALHRAGLPAAFEPVPQSALARGAAVQRGGTGVAGQMRGRRPAAAAGDLVAERSQPAAHGSLAERDLPRREPVLPRSRRRRGPGPLGVGVPGLAFGNRAPRDLARLGHRGVVLLAEEAAELGEACRRLGNQLLVPELEVRAGGQLTRGPATAVDRLDPGE